METVAITVATIGVMALVGIAFTVICAVIVAAWSH